VKNFDNYQDARYVRENENNIRVVHIYTKLNANGALIFFTTNQPHN